MDEVDITYKENIRDALQVKDINKLMELVPNLDYNIALAYINAWQINYGQTMAKVRMGEDTTELDNEAYGILYSLLEKANLSRYHR